jgi:hypothetical protein
LFYILATRCKNLVIFLGWKFGKLVSFFSPPQTSFLCVMMKSYFSGSKKKKKKIAPKKILVPIDREREREN